jgi:serine O-acetyltransferase
MLRHDMARHLEAEGEPAPGRLKQLGAILMPSTLAVLLYRCSHFLHVNGWTRSAARIRRFNLLVHKATLTAASCIGPGFFLPHPAGVLFHGRAGERLTIYFSALCSSMGAPGGLEDAPVLGDDVTVGSMSSVLGPVRVGSGTRIAFRVTLRESVPEGSLVSAFTRATLVERADSR